MSAVRYFNAIPHIVRYGMHDSNQQKCWILFYRCGAQFTIHVSHEIVHSTPFYALWRPPLRERRRESETVQEYINNQWYALCDLIISHSIAALENLAPKKPYWGELRDYLHIPTYTLMLVTNAETQDVYANVTGGPEEKTAYEFEPIPATSFKNRLPSSIPKYSSAEITVLDAANDWCVPPGKVQLPGGRVVAFKGCKRSSRSVETGEVRNEAMDAMEVYFKLIGHAHGLRDVNGVVVATVLGVVMDMSSSGETLVAGILLAWMPPHRTLAEVVEQAGMESAARHKILEQSRGWKSQVESAVAWYHSVGICFEGRNDKSSINQYTILIDGEGMASVNLDVAVEVDGSLGEKLNAKGLEADREAIERLFGEWLPSQGSERGSW